MSNQPAFTLTPKGTKLPLLNLKGKQYLMGAYRLVWLNEEVPNFEVQTHFHLLTDDQTICTATITIVDDEGKVIKKAMATKRETKKDFPDHTEKAESSAVFRALAMLGFGTQFATVEFDEGQRIVDSPLIPTENRSTTVDTKATNTATLSAESVKAISPETPKTGGGFKKPTAKAATPAPVDDGGWQ